MTLTQLIQFKTITETMNMTKAAKVLFVSESSLSQNLAKLENELGVQLFERNKKRLTLNEYGRRLLIHVNIIEREVSLIKEEIPEMTLQSKTLKVISFEEASLRYLCSAISMKYPDIILKTVIKDKSDEISSVLQGETDIAILDSAADEKELFSALICINKPKLSVPYGHRFFNRDSVSWEELSGEYFITLPDHSTYLLDKVMKLLEDNNIMIHRLIQRDYGLYRIVIENTPFLCFESTLSSSNDNANRRKLISITPDYNLPLYACCHWKKKAKMEPYLRCMKEYYHRSQN